MHKYYNEIMVDLETLGRSNNSAIVSIGAVKFNLSDVETYDQIKEGYRRSFYRTISLNDLNGEIEGEVLQWWFKQSNEAQRIFTDPSNGNTHDALIAFTDWVNQIEEGEHRVWGNGSSFDNVILRAAYERKNLRAPWSWRHDMDVRTLKYLTTLKNPDLDLSSSYKTPGTSHNALDDAIRQVLLVQRCWGAINGNIDEPKREQ